MKNFDYIDEQTLSAFVDGQLDAAHRSSVIKAMDKDPEVRDQVYQLRRAKDLMQLGFDGAMPPSSATRRARPRRRFAMGVAASFSALAIGVAAGTLSYYCARALDSGTPAMASLEQPQHHRVVLHIGDSKPEHFMAALNYVDKFLKENAASGGKIEVVANSGGLDLMRTGRSPFEKRVVEMINRHNNVHFIACTNAIRNLKLRGIEPRIIKDVSSRQTALEHIVQRVQSGWTYIKAESLPEV